jgi:hypothetical protein
LKQYREIPYNYTSFSDKEIMCQFLGVDAPPVIVVARRKVSMAFCAVSTSFIVICRLEKSA